MASINYVDTHAFTTAGGVVSGDIKLNVGFDLLRSLGCNDLTTGKKFALLLGTDRNTISHSLPDSQLKVAVPVKKKLILINQQPICDFGLDAILYSQPLDMDLHLIKNVKSPANKFDAVNKAYVDRIKYKTATGIIPTNIMTDHTFFTFPAVKAFASGKIILCEMWVERLTDEWIATSRPMFTTA